MKKKLGFSIVEALMVLLLVAITAVISTPVLLKKTDKKEIIQHGSWECKLSGAGHVETIRNPNGTIKSGPTAKGNSCEFRPPSNANNFQVDICGGNPLTNCRDDNGTHVFMQYKSLPRIKDIKIGPATVAFGSYAYAFKLDDMARILIVY